MCNSCGHSANAEYHNINDQNNEVKCLSCGNSALNEKTAIEVGHAFFLGTRYSKAFNTFVTSADGKQKEYFIIIYFDMSYKLYFV